MQYSPYLHLRYMHLTDSVANTPSRTAMDLSQDQFLVMNALSCATVLLLPVTVPSSRNRWCTLQNTALHGWHRLENRPSNFQLLSVHFHYRIRTQKEYVFFICELCIHRHSRRGDFFLNTTRHRTNNLLSSTANTIYLPSGSCVHMERASPEHQNLCTRSARTGELAFETGWLL
jgi:hypothetical protein